MAWSWICFQKKQRSRGMPWSCRMLQNVYEWHRALPRPWWRAGTPLTSFLPHPPPSLSILSILSPRQAPHMTRRCAAIAHCVGSKVVVTERKDDNAWAPTDSPSWTPVLWLIMEPVTSTALVQASARTTNSLIKTGRSAIVGLPAVMLHAGELSFLKKRVEG